MVRDTTTVWGASGWHKDSIARDPKKVEFLERVKRWAVDAQNRMDAAFKKDAQAFVDLRPMDEYLADRMRSEIVKSERLHSTEEKLGALKYLFSKGLLTEPQFNE